MSDWISNPNQFMGVLNQPVQMHQILQHMRNSQNCFGLDCTESSVSQSSCRRIFVAAGPPSVGAVVCDGDAFWFVILCKSLLADQSATVCRQCWLFPYSPKNACFNLGMSGLPQTFWIQCTKKTLAMINNCILLAAWCRKGVILSNWCFRRWN